MIFNMTGGGSGGAGGGATLVVSCPSNVTVTVSKDDKSYTKNSGGLGSATFKGLTTGEWTITIQNSLQTATKSIAVTADYAITMAFFAAYINITYPANSNCVIQNSGGTTVASDTNSTSSTKTWKATVITTGTYTIVSTAIDGSGKSKSTTVTITTDGQSSSITLTYELYLFKSGSGVTPGYSVEVYGPSDKNNDGIYIGYDSSLSGAFNISPTVDLSNYSKLKFDVQASVFQNDAETVQLGVGSSKPNAYGNGGWTAYSSIATYDTRRQTITVDISNISDYLYVKAWANAVRFNVYNIWLE